jgi:alpha/beta superfamily hydrolase
MRSEHSEPEPESERAVATPSIDVRIPGPVGTLVGVLEEPPGPTRAQAVVCHPHPVHGGSLRNTIVVRVARALRQAGIATLRFNFRGVEGSEGHYDGTQEVDDVAAAAAFVAGRRPELPLWAAGYSFGSRMCCELAVRDPGLERLCLIAFPSKIYDPGLLAGLGTPALLVFGSADEFGTAADLRRRVRVLPPGFQVVEIEGADHFFRGRTPLVEEAVLRYARAAFGEEAP